MGRSGFVKPEFLEEVKKCKTKDALAALVKREGFDLADDVLEAITSGKLDPRNHDWLGAGKGKVGD